MNIGYFPKRDISRLPPHFPCDILLLGADGIGVDGGGGKLGVAEPFLHHVEGDAAGDGGDTEGMAQALGGRGRAGQAGGGHDRMHRPPTGHAGPGPQPGGRSTATPALGLADAMHQVQGLEQGGGHRHGAIDPVLALLERGEHQHAAGQVHPVRRQGEGLGQAAARPGQGHAQRAGLARRLLGRAQEPRPLGDREVFAAPVAVEQLHPAGGACRGRPLARFWGAAHPAGLSR